MSASEARGFLAAICANPDDNTARLVFADWLDEQGDAPRAEFIRTQIERAVLPAWDIRHVRLLMREHALLQQHGLDWRTELPDIKGIVWGEFRRGFVATAKFNNFALFKTDGPECWAAAPIEAVEVRWPRTRDAAPVPGLRELSITTRLVAPDDLSRLIDSPVLSTLRKLTIREAALGPDGFRRLISSPHLKSLAALRVPHNSVGNQAVDALIASTSLPALTELDLSEIKSYGRYSEDPIIDGFGALKLAEWPGLARLRSLSLSGNDLKLSGLSALLQSPHAVGLKHLAVRGNVLYWPSMQEFGTARAGLQLESLDVGENALGDPGAGYLAKAACLRGLKMLHADRCEFGPAAIGKLAKAPFFAGLRVLDAGYNNLGTKGLTALLVAKPAELHTLAIPGCDLGNAGAAKLANSPSSDVLIDVDLGWNNLGDKAILALAATEHLRNLLALRIAYNHPITRRGAEALAKSALGKRLVITDPPPPLEANLPPAGPDDPIPF